MTWPKTLALTACCVCLGLSAAATARAAAAPGTFVVAIAVSGGHDGTFSFGMDPSATSAADTTFDVPLPPAVPGGADVTFLGAPPFSRLSTDIRAEAAAGAVWRLRVTVVAGQPITLTWGSPSGTFLEGKALLLKRTSGGTDVNMKTTSSLTVSSTTTYTILLGDGGSLAPVASIADAEVFEGNAGTSRMEFPVELSAASTLPVSIHYATVDGTATVADGDYVVQSGTVTFSPSETAITIAVLVNGDTQTESDERFSVVLSAPLNATLIGAEGSGTIRNDDTGSGPPPEISIADAQISEGNTGTTVLGFPVTLSAASASTISVSYATADGSATVVSGDYLAAGDVLTFAPGEVTKTIAVTVHGDAAVESDEQFTVSLSAPVNATLLDAQGAGTIRNDDTSSGPPDWRPPAGLLNTMTVHAVVRLGDGSFVSAAGSLLAAFKGDAIRGVATIFNGPATPMQFQVSVGSNSSSESGLTFRVYDAGSSVVYDITETADFVADMTRGTIVVPLEYHADGGQPSSPAIAIADVSANEGNAGTSSLQFAVTLSAASTAAVTVNYATADGSATLADADYLSVSGQLTFAVGETTKTITVQITGDTAVEPDETFTVALSSPVNATLADGQATGTLRNDDTAALPTLTIADVSASEGNAGQTAFAFVVTLSAASSATVTVNYATANGTATSAGLDYTAASGQLSFSPGETTKTITVQITGDTAVEPDETFTVALSSPGNATLADGQATGTLRNDDVAQGRPDWQPPSGLLNTMTVHAVVRFSDTTYVSATGSLLAAFKDGAIRGVCTIFNGPATPLQFQLSVGSNGTAESGLTLKVYDAGSNAVYDITEAVDFVADTTRGTIVVPLEFHASGVPSSSPALALADAQGNEGNSGTSTLQFAVTLSPAATAVVTVNYATADGSATVADADYLSASGQLTFAVGETTKTITVQIRGDSKYESNETFTVTLSSPTDATLADGQATGTLLNDDAAGSSPTLTIQDASAAAGGSAAFGVALSAASASAVSVSYATADGTATAAGGDYQPVSGTLTFAPGQTAQTVTVTVNASVEAGKTFRLVLANAVGAQIADAEGVGTVRGDGAPWYPSFALVPGDILKVTIRRNDGTLVLESQVVSADGAGQDLFEARNYRHGTGTGRTGLLPGQYHAQVAVWDQVAQQFVATGTQTHLPPVSYSTAATPAPSAMSSTAIDGSNRNWSLKFTGSVQAQGFVIELRKSHSQRAARQIVQEFLPARASATFPVGPLHEELTRVILATGAQQWRLRFFTPLDPPGRSTAATNWSAWRDIVTLTDASLDPNRQPVNPPLGERWYYPESGAMFSADAGTDTASLELSWNPVTHADSYYLHLCTSEGRVVLNRVLVSAAHYPNLTLAPGTYFWAVCPVNSALGRAGIAASWAEPFPFFTVLPGVSADPETPGEVVVTGATRLADGYLRLALSWSGRVAPTVRLLVLDPGIMLDPEDDRDAAPDSYTTNELDRLLTPGTRTLVKVQGHSASGENGPWSAFVPIVIPPKP